MSGGLKRKPLPAELNEALRGAVSGLPSATSEQGRGVDHAPPLPPARRERQKAPPVVQVNFGCSEQMAEVISREADKVGSTRRFIARLLKDAGFEISDFDVNPVDNRKRIYRASGG
jgi:hypothetical protein